MSIIDNILRNYFYNDILKIIQYMHLTDSLKYSCIIVIIKQKVFQKK